MRPVLTADEMRRLDRYAADVLGIPTATLMENAGRAAAATILEALPPLGLRPGSRIAVVCGKGGNGGDGFVCARWLKRRGARPMVLLATPAHEITGDAKDKLAELRRARIAPVPIGDVGAPAVMKGADLIVDALLGTGTRGAPGAGVAQAIDWINASGRPVVALDVPSGLPADGGEPPGAVINATLTVTFAALKRGLVTGPGLSRAGRVDVVPIGIPAEDINRGVETFLLERQDVAALVPRRSRRGHKGDYGHLLIVAGSLGKTGAAALAATAAMRTGVGLVTVATALSQQHIVASLVLESMTEALPETPARSIALKAYDAIVELAGRRDAAAVGPGLGLEPETQQLVRELTRDLRVPLVIDADGLSALAGHTDLLRMALAPRCLTPHPGEMARMLGTTVAEVERDRIQTTRDFARARGAWVVLKGAGTVIAAPDGRVWVNPTGNPGMASGGTGDVLTGIAGAFLARGLEPAAALPLAVYLHGLAGDVAAERVGEESLIASDLIGALPEAFRRLAGDD